jgi:hypothetical protein
MGSILASTLVFAVCLYIGLTHWFSGLWIGPVAVVGAIVFYVTVWSAYVSWKLRD